MNPRVEMDAELRRSLTGRPYGNSRVGYFEHEVSNWIRGRVRQSTGEPAAPPLPMPDTPRIITVREAQQRTGLSRMQLWRLEKRGQFPQRVRMTPDPIGEASDAAD